MEIFTFKIDSKNVIASARCSCSSCCIKSAIESYNEKVYVSWGEKRKNTTRRQKTENCIISLTYPTLIHIDKVNAENVKKFLHHICKCFFLFAHRLVNLFLGCTRNRKVKLK